MLDLVDTDVSVPFQVMTHIAARYLATLIDDWQVTPLFLPVFETYE